MIELFNSKKIFYFSFTFIAIILLFVCFYFDGTGGSGDSIFHYQYAKFALTHPENFFNHWAKPLFTMLAFPFAQFNFIGIKLFNLFMSLIACYFTYKTLKKFEVDNCEWIAVILFSITLYVTVTLSGLTEPLSAAMLMFSIYLITKNHTISGVSIISFLPFVRSEGLVIIGVFLLYLLVSKKYKFIPLLSVGHVFMSVLGSFYYHDLFWVFTKIPYAEINGVYGKGTWLHFAEQLFFQLGFIEYSLLILGGISMLSTIFRRKDKPQYFNEKLWLIYGCFIAFFISHTSFWALGIFNSMGLSRVFVSVMPLVAMIALDGLNFIEYLAFKINTKTAAFIKYLILIVISILPFLNSPASYKLSKDFELDKTQLLIKDNVAPYINHYHQNKKMIVADVSVPFYTNTDVFNKSACNMFYGNSDFYTIASNEIVVWDNWWFGPVYKCISLDSMMSIKSLKLDTLIHTKNENGKDVQYGIFIKR